MGIIGKNINHLRKLKGLTQEQLADELDITRARIGSYEEGRSEPPSKLLITFSDYFNLPVDILIRHNLTKVDNDKYLELENSRLLFPITVDKEDNNQIEVVDQKAQAGYSTGYADPEYVESLPRMNLPFIPTGKFRAFPVKGDSMPPLTDGTFVVGKFMEDHQNIKDGNTYIVVTREDGIVYKRVFNRLTEEGTLNLHSDNKAYQPYSISHNDILEVWEFTCSINLNDTEPEMLNPDSILAMMRELKIDVTAIRTQVES